MGATAYDEHAEFYVDFVDRGLASDDGHYAFLLSRITDCVGRPHAKRPRLRHGSSKALRNEAIRSRVAQVLIAQVDVRPELGGAVIVYRDRPIEDVDRKAS